jgi:hypothetical protein
MLSALWLEDPHPVLATNLIMMIVTMISRLKQPKQLIIPQHQRSLSMELLKRRI